MRSSQKIRRFPANGGQPRKPDPLEANARQVQLPRHGLQRRNVSQPITVFAQPDAPSICTPKAPFRPRRTSQNAKIERVKTRNEVNLTSENYGARAPENEEIERAKFPNELNLTSDKYGVFNRAFLSRARHLATLFVYVSEPHSPAPPPPSGDVCVAGPGLIRSCKSNERMPAAVPAGFFIALSGLRSQK
jgi:hypothetical protein